MYFPVNICIMYTYKAVLIHTSKYSFLISICQSWYITVIQYEFDGMIGVRIVTGKTLDRLPWNSKVPLQRDGMVAIPKRLVNIRNYLCLYNFWRRNDIFAPKINLVSPMLA